MLSSLLFSFDVIMAGLFVGLFMLLLFAPSPAGEKR